MILIPALLVLAIGCVLTSIEDSPKRKRIAVQLSGRVYRY